MLPVDVDAETCGPLGQIERVADIDLEGLIEHLDLIRAQHPEDGSLALLATEWRVFFAQGAQGAVDSKCGGFDQGPSVRPRPRRVTARPIRLGKFMGIGGAVFTRLFYYPSSGVRFPHRHVDGQREETDDDGEGNDQ